MVCVHNLPIEFRNGSKDARMLEEAVLTEVAQSHFGSLSSLDSIQ